jgi:hypothetical protein
VKRVKTIVVLAGLLATAIVTKAQAQDFKQRYVGKGPCAPDLQSEYSDLSMRLDKTQGLELYQRRWDRLQVLLIVQYRDQNDGCGVIRDAVRITHLARHKHFEFRCFDAQAPTDVVVGTVIRGYGNTKLVTAIEAWRIDLKQQTFVEVHHKVVCSADGFDGEDDGSDMADDAKKYAAHGKPGQFGPESK